MAEARRCASRRKESAPAEPATGRMIKDGNFENLNDWNVVEVIWQGDQAAHIVNGRTVNTISKLQQPDPQKPGKVHSVDAWEDRDRDRVCIERGPANRRPSFNACLPVCPY
jgi:hypothetical protein